MEPDALDAPDAKEGEAEVVLEVAELALDGGATTVQPAPLFALARDAPRS